MHRSFAISDIHGCSRTFRHLVEEKIALQKEDELFLLGDYVDRGKDSKGVIDFILALRNEGYRIHTLRGNHEDMMMHSERGRNSYLQWVYNGGMSTLNSFGVVSYDDLPLAYKEFFEQTVFFIEYENYILVHAGLNFLRPNPLEDTHLMMWIREFTPKAEWLGSRSIVHGHTPKTLKDIIRQADQQVLNIDGGCAYSETRVLGKLVAFNLHTKEIISTPTREA